MEEEKSAAILCWNSKGKHNRNSKLCRIWPLFFMGQGSIEKHACFCINCVHFIHESIFNGRQMTLSIGSMPCRKTENSMLSTANKEHH